MLREYKTPTIDRLPRPIINFQAEKERLAMAHFVAKIDTFGPLTEASQALQARLLSEIKTVARYIDGSSESGVESGYGRRVLYEDPDRWSLAAVILRPGQRTELHDHASWGCAMTIQGIERDRRFVHDEYGNPVLSYERDYPAGTGYFFDPVDIHQPLGADPWQVTVALHFLVHDNRHHSANPEIIRLSEPITSIAA